MAVLDAMGLLDGDGSFRAGGIARRAVQRSWLGRTMVGELPAIVPEIDGSAWITGEHVFVADPADPFAEGVVV